MGKSKKFIYLTCINNTKRITTMALTATTLKFFAPAAPAVREYCGQNLDLRANYAKFNAIKPADPLS
jgi:hypothetical protein